MTNPMTPTPPPAPVDLDALAAELEHAGWTDAHYRGETLILYHHRPESDRTQDVSRVTVYNSDNGPAITVADWYCGIRASVDDLDSQTMWPPEIAKPHWQHALSIIRRHTQPTEGATACGASSHDQEQSA